MPLPGSATWSSKRWNDAGLCENNTPFTIYVSLDRQCSSGNFYPAPP